METELSTERFAKFEDRQFVTAAEEPISTFAAEADSGAYTIARRMIREGQLPPRDLIRIEEFLNAFDYADRGPNADTSAPFAIHTEVGRCPWNTDARLPAHRPEGPDSGRRAHPAAQPRVPARRVRVDELRR